MAVVIQETGSQRTEETTRGNGSGPEPQLQPENRKAVTEELGGSLLAGLIVVAPIVPITAAVGTAIFQISSPGTASSGLGIVAALLVVGLVWVIAGLIASAQADVARCNPRVYHNLVSVSCKLESSLGRLSNPVLSQAGPGREVITALRTELFELQSVLNLRPHMLSSGDEGTPRYRFNKSDWPLATAYNELYRRAHCIEADRLLVCDRAELLDSARDDYFRLQDSGIEENVAWQYQLEMSVAELGEDCSTFFRRPPAASADARTTTSADRVEPPPLAPVRYRLRAARKLVDDYRDTHFEALVRQRLRTMWAVVATGVVVYLLVLIAVQQRIEAPVMLAATVLFLTGALVGLFSRLAMQGDQSSTVEDYGLSTIRLLQTVILSGVAAVLGVVILAYSVTTVADSGALPAVAPAEESSVALKDFFDLQTYPVAILLAAMFGLTPRLLLNRLEATADRLKLNIKNIEST